MRRTCEQRVNQVVVVLGAVGTGDVVCDQISAIISELNSTFNYKWERIIAKQNKTIVNGV